MAWKLAPALETLRSQINASWPKRSKVSDGTIGDARHRKKKSDHNPRENVVTAFDITEDFKNGPDLTKLLPMLLRDGRTKYCIYETKLYKPDGTVQDNSGHTQHLHISVVWARRNEAQPWNLAPQGSAEAPPMAAKIVLLKRGAAGPAVLALQKRLKELGFYKDVPDGYFGPKTEAAVKAFQKASGLKQDGKVGPKTQEALTPPPTPAKGSTPVTPEQKGYSNPVNVAKYYMNAGWSKEVAAVLTAALMWESGGNRKKPQTIIYDAHGDKGTDGLFHSHGAGQWNDKQGRYDALLKLADERKKPWDDPETQLAYLQKELETTEKRAAALLRAATTLEEANAAAIKVWRPGVPHADRRLALAKGVYAKL